MSGIAGRLLRRRRLRATEERLVWIVGSPRSGTTWLANLLARPGTVMLDEPCIGVHLGYFAHEFWGSPAGNFPLEGTLFSEVMRDNKDYFFADRFEEAWAPPLRELILTRLRAQVERGGRAGDLCLIKEPNGSQAIGMIRRLLPRSRILWVLRDGRDVVDSELDAVSRGGWTQRFDATWDLSPADRLRYVEDRAYRWLRRTQIVEAAFAAHRPELRMRVRYEDLLVDTVDGVEAILGWLGTPVARAELSERVDALAFDRVPEAERGPGKFVRSATAGAWRENLGPDEQRILGEVLDPKLRELGYEVGGSTTLRDRR